MNAIAYNNTEYTKDTLFKNLTGKQLVALHNELAAKAKVEPTRRFSTIGAGIERTWKLLEAVGVPVGGKPAAKLPTNLTGGSLGNGATTPKVKREKAPATAATKPQRRAEDKAPVRRGTNLAAPGHDPLPCREGSKQAIMVNLLSRAKGATMAELIEGLSGGNKPWTEVSVRSGFGWDMKQKGYGVRSDFDSKGVEHFHLVLPEGKTVPAHRGLKTQTPKAHAGQGRLTV